MASITIRDLTFSYPPFPDGTRKTALSALSASIPDGAFVTIYGANGSGKSTLLRVLKREIAPLGEMTGTILIDDVPLSALSDRDSACRIGYVGQQPEEQIVTDRVWHELAFGLENLGMPNTVIRRRVAEIACLFGIEDWFEKDTASLSGGQKQILSLAAVMTMDPDILLLDEPTSQLDPIASVAFLSAVARLHREFSITILLVEHQLEEALPYTDTLLVLTEGGVCAYGDVSAVLPVLRDKPSLLCGMPSAVQLFAPYTDRCPVTIRDGKQFLLTHFDNRIRSLPEPEKMNSPCETALSFREVWFRYGKDTPDVLRGLTFSVPVSSIFCILGGNGSGKSTMLSVLSGWLRPYAGQVQVFGKRLRDYKGESLFQECIAYLPQDVTTLFSFATVAEELADVGASVPDVLAHAAQTHPYDLSGGEKQILALTKVLSTNPRLLLLDEPTKGLDSAARNRLTAMLSTLRNKGITIVCVTHDVDFAAGIADWCAFFFRGEITSIDTPRRFFSDNRFYTTAVSRITRGHFDGAVTLQDAQSLCKQNGYREEHI